eukprot:4609-Heterococcus_DN1.PRE.4
MQPISAISDSELLHDSNLNVNNSYTALLWYGLLEYHISFQLLKADEHVGWIKRLLLLPVLQQSLFV